MFHIRCNGNKVEYISSNAENWISAWSLISLFKLELPEQLKQYKLEKSKQPLNDKDIIQSAYRDGHVSMITIKVPVNEANYQLAMQHIKELTTPGNENGIVCPPEEFPTIKKLNSPDPVPAENNNNDLYS